MVMADSDVPKRSGKAPIDIAIALEYNKAHDAAPRLIAKGAGVMAEKIVALAIQHNIPITKDTTLVALLKHLEMDEVIPVEAYVAVAEILTYIYKKDKERTFPSQGAGAQKEQPS
jgi:flagellar biosynthesis protein